uniref:LEM domain-containing protein n=1 Tax=Ciona savignyi TaxID=51511 RepID=H2YT96_CIOSA
MVKETELTDQELRQELTKYGISFGPILPTTRPIYLKKLLKTQSENKIPGIEKPTNGNHSDSSKSNKSLKQSKIQRKTFGFSSDESDGNEDSNKSRAYTTRRTKRPSPVNQSTPKDIKKPVHRRIEKLAHVRPTRRSVTPPVANGYSDDSEEEVTSADVSTSPRLYQSISSRSSMTPRRPLTQTMTSSMTSSVEHNGVKSLRKRKFDSTKDDDDDDSVSQENDSAEEIVTSVKETESSKTNIFTYLKSLFLTKDKEKFGN